MNNIVATQCACFFLQSAKTNLNVEEVFFSIARDIKQRLSDSDTSRTEVSCPALVYLIFKRVTALPTNLFDELFSGLNCSRLQSRLVSPMQLLVVANLHRSQLAVAHERMGKDKIQCTKVCAALLKRKQVGKAIMVKKSMDSVVFFSSGICCSVY